MARYTPAGGGGGGAVYRDTYASVAAETPAVGDRAFCTDNPALELYCAVAGTWIGRYGGREVAGLPAAQLDTWLNQGSSTYSEATGSGVFTVEGSGGGTQIRCRTDAFTGARRMEVLLDTSGGNAEALMGVCVSDGTELIVLYVGSILGVRHYSNVTTFAGNLVSVGTHFKPFIWLAIEDNATNIICEYGANGEDWLRIYEAGRTSVIAAGPDRIGIFGDSESARDVQVVLASVVMS